jgi:hypothetical protein
MTHIADAAGGRAMPKSSYVILRRTPSGLKAESVFETKTLPGGETITIVSEDTHKRALQNAGRVLEVEGDARKDE